MNFVKKNKLTVITFVYWFLLIYVVAALVWWFISLDRQNKKMYAFRKELLNKETASYPRQLSVLEDEYSRKTTQYVGEGAIFLLLMLIGAAFVYKTTRKEIKLSQQQRNFMMAVTHELKTPIAIARLNLETMQKRKLDEAQQQKLISGTLQETNRLDLLCNNILLSSQFEAGTYLLNKQSINMSELVDKCIKDYTARFASRIITGSIEKDIFFEGEQLLLQMLLHNLLDNALKYSPKEKAIHVVLKMNDNKRILQVIDQGQGIPEKEKEKVFEKFYRMGSENTRTTKGTGLGLYLCTKIAHDHKGSITLQDNQPQGCIFIVSL